MNIAAQLAALDEDLSDKEKISRLVRTLPESLATIAMISNLLGSLENVESAIRAEVDRKKSPNKKQDGALFSQANVTQTRPREGRSSDRRPEDPRKKKRKCNYCHKPGHLAKDCYLRRADEARGREVRKEFRRNKRNRRNQFEPNRFQGWQNNRFPRQRNGSHGQPDQDEDAQALIANAAAAAVRAYNNQQNPHQANFRGFMAKLKYRSNVASLSDEKCADAYVDSGATHHFFHSKTSFQTYEKIRPESVKAASSTSKLVGKGTIKFPINGGILFEAYHVPYFSSNILSVRLLLKSCDIDFSENSIGQAFCTLKDKQTSATILCIPEEDCLFPLKIEKQNFIIYRSPRKSYAKC